MQLKPKIALLILPIVLLQMVVLIVPSFTLYKNFFSEQIKGHINDSIAQVQSTLDTQLHTMEADSQIFSQSALLNRYLRTNDENIRFNIMHKALLDEFSSFMAAHPEYLEISLLMPDGYEEVSLHNDTVRNLTDNEQDTLYFQHIQKSSLDFEITPLINPDTEQWALVLARKIYQKELIEQSILTPKKIKGYFIVKVNFDFMSNVFEHNSLMDNGFMMIHSATGQAITIKGDKATANHYLLNTFMQLPAEKTLQMGDWSVNETSYLLGEKQLISGIFYSIGWPESDLNVLLKNMGYRSLINSLLALVFSALLLFWVLNKLLIRPILKLSVSAQKMGKQGGRWSFHSQSKDELGELANTIKEMGQGLIKQKLRVHEIAYIDSLTKLPNRRQFNKDLDSQYGNPIKKRPNIALLFIDLDGFKQVNDSSGHDVGDQVLVVVSKRLKNLLRADDRINFTENASRSRLHKIARLGGDEFTILLQDINERKTAERIAQRILHVLNLAITIEDHKYFISASIGIAVAAECGQSASDLLKNADTAMYEAKVKGKNTYCFFSKIAALKTLQVIKMKEDIRKAINNNELQLAFQPQICTQTGKMVGCEALIRWYQPCKGWIPPDLFIPIAEQSDLIVSLGRWVLQTACLQIKEWQRLGYPPVPVWVNVSCAQLAREDMHQVILDYLEETGIPPELLAIEVTESSIMQGTDSIAQLERIQEEGIHIALDDFGTGYSSLSALRGLPIDELKIDKSFINDLNNGEDGKAIVCAIIAMAHQLNLQVVAEGIETAEELKFLKQSHADIIQGYYFSKPLLAEEFTQRYLPLANLQLSSLQTSSVTIKR